MKTITITQKDIAKYKLLNTDTNQVIDELAYAAKEWTSTELYENNFGYEPGEPYQFNYEKDLLENTKTLADLQRVCAHISTDYLAFSYNFLEPGNLQAGAYVALTYPEQWDSLLEAYTESLKENGTESISKEYNKQLEEERDSFHDDQYKEWLNGDRDYRGVIYQISKYFTENTNGEYDNNTDEYAFTLEEEDIENAKDFGYNKNQLKSYIMDSVKSSSEARVYREKQEREERRIERERLAAYKAERTEKEQAQRRAKLLSLTA